MWKGLENLHVLLLPSFLFFTTFFAVLHFPLSFFLFRSFSKRPRSSWSLALSVVTLKISIFSHVTQNVPLFYFPCFYICVVCFSQTDQTSINLHQHGLLSLVQIPFAVWLRSLQNAGLIFLFLPPWRVRTFFLALPSSCTSLSALFMNTKMSAASPISWLLTPDIILFFVLCKL